MKKLLLTLFFIAWLASACTLQSTSTPELPTATATRTASPVPSSLPTSTPRVNPTATEPASIGTAIWEKLADPAQLPDRGMTTAYDSNRNVIVLFGGTSGVSQVLSDTWEFNGTAWSKISTANKPPARFWHGVAYDNKRKVIVLFGGEKSALSGGLLNDTWEYDGKDWRQIDTPQTPPARGYGVMLAFDTCRNKTIMFGGKDSSGLPGTTWEYDGKNWSQVQTSTNPSGRWLSAMAFDANRCKLVLFGGGDGLGDTWEYDGQNWAKITTANAPAARWAHSMAFNPVTGHIVLFGGYNPKTQKPMNDTWVYNGMDWYKLAAKNPPPAREQQSMTYWSETEQMLIVSGFGSDGNWLLKEDTPNLATEPGNGTNCALGFTRLKIGDYAQPAGEPSLANRIRSEAKLGDNIIAGFTPGMFVKVIDGPVCADDFVFWKVESRFIPSGMGWTAEGDGITYFLEPLK